MKIKFASVWLFSLIMVSCGLSAQEKVLVLELEGGKNYKLEVPLSRIPYFTRLN